MEKVSHDIQEKVSGIENIPIQSRMITIADIYDALVASDRPYKKAISQKNALAILRNEVNADKLDKELFEIFTKFKIYEKNDQNFCK